MAAATGLQDIFRPCRHESIPIRHLDLGQTLGVKDLALLNDAVPIEQKSGQSIHLVGAERSFLTSGHGAVDIVPYHRRKRPETPNGLHRLRGVERALASH